MPVATAEAEKPPPKAPPVPPSPGGAGYLASLGLGLGFTRTDLSGGTEGATAGGLSLQLGLSGFDSSLSVGARLGAFVGGGSAGMDSVLDARVFVGGGPAVTDHSQVFFRLGAEGSSLKNDEVEASLVTIPAVQIGYQLWGHGGGFEIAPRIGLSPRTEYEPGDESLGRRHWRKVGVRASGGASLFVTAADAFSLDVSYTRIVDEDPVDHVDGRACVTPFYVALCAISQYWRSVATLPLSTAAQEIPTLYLGGAIGIGMTGGKTEKIF